MRPKICWSDLRGARVGVWGLGVEGTASVARLLMMGVEPVLVDDRPPGRDVEGLPVFATADSGLAALEHCDVVVKAPGISRYRPDVAALEARGIPVAGGLGLWLQEADAERVVCITGTKGKSTTTAIAGHLLTRLGYACLTGGNIGRPPWDPALDGTAYDYWIIETSSYQATDLACSPPVVAVTSLHPDHLDWHGGVEAYYRDKLSVASQPGADLTIANGDSELLRERAALLGPRVRWIGAGDDPAADWMAPLGLLGAHNRRNALIARAVPGRPGRAAGRRRRRAPHRRRRVRAPQPPPAAGRDDRRRDVRGRQPVHQRAAHPGRHGRLPGPPGRADRRRPRPRHRLRPAGRRPGPAHRPHPGPHAARQRRPDRRRLRRGHGPPAETMAGPPPPRRRPPWRSARAPTWMRPSGPGSAWARPDGIVLLSPAAPSFGAFRDYRDRGEAFTRAMHACAG